ncbi:MAG: hypothetical protein ACYTXT_41595 [Nostoc sp.]
MQEILLCGDRSYFWTGFGASGERYLLFCLWPCPTAIVLPLLLEMPIPLPAQLRGISFLQMKFD